VQKQFILDRMSLPRGNRIRIKVGETLMPRVVVTQVPLHGIRLSQRELHQMNVPDVKVETQNSSIRNDEGSASLVKSVKEQIASNWL